jgi:hypothetical protein
MRIVDVNVYVLSPVSAVAVWKGGSLDTRT